MNLRGAVAIVTGGAAGLGLVIAERLVDEGASVVVADVAEGSLAAREEDSRVAFVRADLRVAADVERLVAFAVERFGSVHVLVNNAGGGGHIEPHFPRASAADWGGTLDLNLRAPMFATQLVLEPMRAAGGGAVVNIASTAGLGFEPYVSPEYGAAKAGLIRFTTSVAWLRDEHGVRVNCIVPDWILTERARDELARMTPAQRAAAPTPVDPTDIADVAVRFARDESLAGRVVVMRGGEPLRWLGTGTEET